MDPKSFVAVTVEMMTAFLGTMRLFKTQFFEKKAMMPAKKNCGQSFLLVSEMTNINKHFTVV